MHNYYLSLKRSVNNIFRNEKQGLFCLFLVAIFLRTVFVIIIYKIQGVTDAGDTVRFLTAGESIANGNWNPPRSESQPFLMDAPFVPIMVALFYKIFNTALIPMFVFNIVIGSLSVIPIYYLGKEIFYKKVGWAVSIWAAICLETFHYYGRVAKEPLLFLLLPLSILLIIRSANEGLKLKLIIISATVFVLLIHTDERFFLYFPVFMLFYFLIHRYSLQNRIKTVILWGLLVLLMMVPWTVRNYVFFDQLVILAPRTTAFTSKVWGENIMNLDMQGDLRKATGEKAIKRNAENLKGEFGRKPRLYSQNEARIRALVYFWQPTLFSVTYIAYGQRPQGPWTLSRNLISIVFFGVFIPLFFAGLPLLIRKRQFVGLFLALIPIIHSLLHAYMVWSLPRYRAPVLFIIAMVGFWAAIEIYRQIQKRISE